ncbi:MAG: N-acetylmuramoyl-L-alanine amidase, partial [Inquilinus sp.]|nr:N-acetylmuramoyl-L-alanine amidase [Inquilinus sp.]
AMGEVVATGRWRLGLWGAHLSARNIGGNFSGIGICLIGDFETMEVQESQLQAAVTLTRDLVRRFGIPPARLAPHGGIAGETTLCPGRNFPIDRFRRDVFAG